MRPLLRSTVVETIMHTVEIGVMVADGADDHEQATVFGTQITRGPRCADCPAT